jgi:hypothetical protein
VNIYICYIGCCIQLTYISQFIMLLWIYPILASRFATRFVTILGKKQGPKGNNHWRKTEIEASLDLILIWWKEIELLQREGKKALCKMPIWAERDRTELSRTTKRGLVLSHAVPFYQPHATWSHSVPRGPFLPAPRDAAPHISTEWSTKWESSRPSSFWGFQTRAWEKLRKN